jgi:hypothetical protein
MANGQRVVLFDDFADPEFTEALWHENQPMEGGNVTLTNTLLPSIYADIAASMGTIDFSYLNRMGNLVVRVGSYEIILADQIIQTPYGPTSFAVPERSHLTIDIEQGHVSLRFDSGTVMITDPTAAPFVFHDAPTTLVIETTNYVTIDDVRVSLPATR